MMVATHGTEAEALTGLVLRWSGASNGDGGTCERASGTNLELAAAT
jgi:hypothetical protein